MYVCVYAFDSRGNISVRLFVICSCTVMCYIDTKIFKFPHILNAFTHIKNSASVTRTSPSYHVWRIVARFSHGCKKRKLNFDY